MKIFLIVINLLLLFSCSKDCDNVTYYNFTDDELSFLLLKDSIVGEKPMSFDYYNKNKYVLNTTDTLNAGLQIYIYQSKYDAYKCPKYMIEGYFSINFTLNNFHNTISLNLLKNDSYCNEKLYKSIKIESCNLEEYNECVQFRAKCFESECCDNDANFIIDSIIVNNKKYEAYLFSFNKDYSKIKEVVFVKNLGFIKITDFDNNEMILNK